MASSSTQQQTAAATLRTVLLVNGGFSLGSGAVLGIAARPLAAAMVPGVASVGPLPLWALVMAVGIGVVLFGLELLRLATRAHLPVVAGRLVFLADAAWVLGSAALLILAGRALSGLAIELILAAGVVVALFAALEYRAMRGMQRQASALPRPQGSTPA